MFKRIIVASILSFSLSFASGLEVGANIKVVKRDGSVINTVIRKMDYKIDKRKFSCVDANTHFFKVPFDNVDKITTRKGVKFKSLSSSGYKYNVLNLRLVNGKSIDCGITKSITVWVSPSGMSSSHRLTITDYNKYNSIEVSNSTTNTKGIIIELIDGRKITVPVSKEEVKSIIFE